MAQELNVLIRYNDENGYERLTGNAVDDFFEENPNMLFNDFAFMSPYYNADLYIDMRGDQTKYAFVCQGEILDTRQYMAEAVQFFGKDISAETKQRLAANIAHLDSNATLMDRLDVQEFINHEYWFDDVQANRNAYHAKLNDWLYMTNGYGTEAEMRVDEITRNNPYVGDYHCGGFVLTNGAYTNVDINAMRTYLQSYFEPGSAEYYSPAHALFTFIDEGNIHWAPPSYNKENITLTIAAHHQITPYQAARLEEMLEYMSDDELLSLEINVYARDREFVETYTLDDKGKVPLDITDAYEDVLSIIEPELKKRNLNRERSDADLEIK